MPNDRRKEIRSMRQESDREQRIFTFKAIQWIWLLLGILETLIAWAVERIVWLLFYRPRWPRVGTTQTTNDDGAPYQTLNVRGNNG